MFNWTTSKFPLTPFVIGTALFIISISLSIFWAFPFWYGPFLLGAWLLFGSINLYRKQKTIFYLVWQGKLFIPLVLYILGGLFGFLVDVVYGRTINNFWLYPFLPGFWNWLIPVFIYYPLGAFHLYEIFYFFKSFFESDSIRAKSFSAKFSLKNTPRVIWPVLVIGFLGAVLPVINFFLRQNSQAGEVTIIAMVLVTFLPDVLDFLVSGRSLLLDTLSGRVSVLLLVFTTWLVAFSTNELPNLFSREWIYQNIPFTSRTFLGVNVVVATVGWIFLVLITVRGIDLVRDFFRLLKMEA